MAGWIQTFFNNQVFRDTLSGADISLGSVEMHIRGNAVPGLDKQAGEDVFRTSALVGGDEMLKPENALHGIGQTVIGTRPCIEFIPSMMPAHCSWLIAPVPESVIRSIYTSSARKENRL